MAATAEQSTEQSRLRDALANCIAEKDGLIGERDRLQARLDRITKLCADETDGDSSAHDSLLARITMLAEGAVL